MVLYYTVSTYHILKSILHKLNYHSNEEAILLVPSTFPKIPAGLKMDRNRIFEKVIYYDWEYKRYDNYPQEIFDDIRKVLSKNIGEEWKKEISEYNVFYAARFFGGYLVTNEIKINWFEEADGRYLNPYPVMRDDKRLCPERFQLANSLGLYTAENTFIQNMYVSLSSNEGAEMNEKIINFETNDELLKLSESDTKKMLEFWDVKEEKMNIEGHSALLMSQHFCNIRIISFEEQVLLYQMTVDYFLENYRIYLKRHPSDLFPYKKFIDGLTDLEADYPSELLRYSCIGKFEIAAAVSSTGVKNMRCISDRQLFLNEEYTNTFKDNDLYYFIGMLLKLCEKYDVIATGVNVRQLKAMLEYAFGLNTKIDFAEDLEDKEYKNRLIVIGPDFRGEISESKMDNSIIVFWEGKGEIEEHRIIKKNKDRISVKKIKIYSIRAKEEKIIAEKHILIISDNKEILKRINSMKYEKLLSNTKIKIRVDSNVEKDIQILTLQGMLDETEKVLENYVKENQRLKMILESHKIDYTL